MVPTPTENTLTINITSEMLRYMDGMYRNIVATAPTRVEERAVGYDVQFAFAMRVQFQYKRPLEPVSRGIPFKVNSQQVTTLRGRDDTSVSYLACPVIPTRANLDDALNQCIFIDAHAVRANTSRVYVPRHYFSRDRRIEGKIRNGPYYPIPERGIKTWADIARGIDNRNIGLVIRQNGQATSQFRRFIERIAKFHNLFRHEGNLGAGRQYITDGGEDDQYREPNWQFVEELVDHAIESQQELYISSNVSSPNWEEERAVLLSMMESRYDTRDPSLTGIRRSRELIIEDGNYAPNMNIS